MKICTFKECHRQLKYRKWCQPHFEQLVKEGSILSRKHGMTGTRFLRIWEKILRRIRNPNCYEYKWYGGRGIKCEWKSFREFKIDMHPSYLKHIKDFGEKQTTIERNNVNGNYSKQNCKPEYHL